MDFFSGYTMHLEIISLHHYLLLDRKGSEQGTAKTSKPLVKGFVHDNDDEVMKITKVLKNKRGGDPLFSEIHMSRLDQAGMTYTSWLSHCQGLKKEWPGQLS